MRRTVTHAAMGMAMRRAFVRDSQVPRSAALVQTDRTHDRTGDEVSR